MFDYIYTKLLLGYFKSFSTLVSFLSLTLFLIENIDIYVKILLIVLIFVLQVLYLVLKKSYSTYSEIADLLEKVSSSEIKIFQAEDDPINDGVRHLLLSGANLKEGQVLVLSLKNNGMEYKLGIMKVVAINGEGFAQCQILATKSNADDHVRDDTRLSQLYANTNVMYADLYE
ncbi:hypothetical protein [Vreelandella sp. EE22]